MKPTFKQMNRQFGKLIFISKSGQTTVLNYREPFDVLQNKKKEYERMGEYKNGRLILAYA